MNVEFAIVWGGLDKIAAQIGISRGKVQNLVERGQDLLASEVSSPRQG